MASPDSAQLQVKVVPGARKNVVAGWLGAQLKLRVTAPPEKGHANKAVVKLLAECLDWPAAAIAITGGQTNPVKRIAIQGLSADQLHARIDAHLAQTG